MATELVPAAPPPALGGAVLRHVGYVERAAAPVRRVEVPGAQVVVILSFGPEIRVDGDRRVSFAAGLGERATVTEHDGEQDGVQLNLSPLAARAVLGVPLRELTDRTVPLEELLGRGASELVERLAGASGWDERFALLDAEVARRLAAAAPPTPAVAWAWRRVLETGGRVRVEALAGELGCSRRYLATRFGDEVGLPPKKLARVVRFGRVVGGLRRGSGLADLAEAAGYADQAHLNRDFRALAGCTPTEFLARWAFPDVQDATPIAA
jgi:AraC-like DNA-binding protein